jgi:hypothetical protein
VVAVATAELTPEALILSLADAFDYDREQIADELRGIAAYADSAAYGRLLGHAPSWSTTERDRLVRDLLDRIAPEYTARSTPKGAAS